MKRLLVVAALVSGSLGSIGPQTANAAITLSPLIATSNHSEVEAVQYRTRRTVVRVYRPRARFSGPGSGTGMGRVYTGPGSGSGMGRMNDNGPGSGTGRGRW